MRKNFRGIVDNLRTNDYRVFVRVNKDKAKQNEKNGVYQQLDDELKKLKEAMEKAN